MSEVLASPPQAGGYRAILADPPWRFATYSERGKGRSAEAHYDCLGPEAIKALPVAKWAAPDAALFMWTTDPMLPQALEVLQAWGFAYKTVAFNWVKLNRGRGPDGWGAADFFTGMGFWTRANAELCLLATRGRPRRRHGDVPRLLIAPRREHSRKPEEIYARVERLVEGPYLELFARASRPGWDAHGNQAGLFDRGPVATRRRRSAATPPVGRD